VVKNDSYYKIAKANGTTIAALKAANPSIDPARIRPGMKLQIPARGESASANTSTAANVSGNSGASTSGSGEGKVYTVKPGDTLTRIARQNGTTISAIRNANGMKTTRVNVGQKLKIPASAKSAPAVKEASTNAGLTY
jgi:LysM repeat protein